MAAVADVNVTEILSNEENKSTIEKLRVALEENPAVQKLMEVAETAEDVYGIVKNYIKVKLEDFKVLYEKTLNFYKEAKVALDDEILDAVAGGGWWSNFWEKHKAGIITAAIFVGCVALGGVAGLAAGAFIGEVAAGIATGLTVGTVTGGVGTIGYVNAQEHIF